MSRKKFEVETANNGQTPTQDKKHAFVYKTLNVVEKTNVPTGKVVTLEDKKKRKEAREKQYRDFRIAALKRRAKRMHIPEENIQELVEKLCEQLEAPTNYLILLMYNKNNAKIVEETMLNNKIEWKMKSDSHMYIEGDSELLGKIRELAPDGTKIHPHVKKHPPILKSKEPPKDRAKTLTKAVKKKAASEAKNARKQANIVRMKARPSKKRPGKLQRKVAKHISLLKKKELNLKKAA